MDVMHFSRVLSFKAIKYGESPALYFKNRENDEWVSISWIDFDERVKLVAKALLALGVAVHDRVAQFSNNKVENLIVDYALYSVRAAVVPMYATSSESQVQFITDDAGVQLIFVGDQVQYDIALSIAKSGGYFKHIIVFNREVNIQSEVAGSMYFDDFINYGEVAALSLLLKDRMSTVSEGDLACLLYTSGTTGNPKGVMLSHSCLMEAIRVHNLRLSDVTHDDVSLAFLPISHVFERMWCYFCINRGVGIYVNEFPVEIQKVLKEVKPTLMCSVPRFWEKVYLGVVENIESLSSLKKKLAVWAFGVGKKYNIDVIRVGKIPSLWLSFCYEVANFLVFSKIKKVIGVQNARLLPTAGAKLSDEINIFLRSMGLPIIYGYGLTESTASVSFYLSEGYKIGTVGTVIPDLRVRIAEDNEIQLKGKTIFSGYYNNPEATCQAFTKDGWFRTGDAGLLVGNTIILTERIKDMFKTSNGKYIAPQEIETLLTLDSYIEQVIVVGDERNFVTALIVPSLKLLEEYAIKENLPYQNVSELFVHPSIYELIESRINYRLMNLAKFEQVKKFVLIHESFSIENGLLTNTMKVKRSVIMKKYQHQIDEMYK